MADVNPNASWISRLRARQGRRQTDWADLGTAYGLDLSMQPEAPAATPAAAADAPHKTAGGRRWWRRLAGSGNGSGR